MADMAKKEHEDNGVLMVVKVARAEDVARQT